MFVKICGITNEDDALFAVAMGADAVGFVFAPSPRQIAPQQVYDITRRLPPEILTVGVFRDELPARVIELVHQAGVKAVQLHGHETPAQAIEVAANIRWVIKAFAAGSAQLGARRPLRHRPDPGRRPEPGFGQGVRLGPGGRGADGLRVILAGGLDPDNVAEAIAVVEPWGVDVSTGVEAAPGRKDAAQGQAVHRQRPRRGTAAVPRARRAAVRLGRRVTRERPMTHRDGRAEPPAASASSVAVSCPRPLSRRVRSSRPRSARRGPTPRSVPSSTPSCATTPAARRCSPSAFDSVSGSALRLLLKREDLNHTGSHKINNVLGQALLAKRMGKTRLVAETGAGQHGVATATAAALMGLECKVYMGAVDVDRQALNVFRMRLLGS